MFLKCKKGYIWQNLESCKIINCIVFGIVLNSTIFKVWMGSVYAWKHQQNHKICTPLNNPVVQSFILTVGNNHVHVYNNLHTRSVLKVNKSNVKLIFMQHFFYTLLYDYLSEKFVKHSFIHFKVLFIHFYTCVFFLLSRIYFMKWLSLKVLTFSSFMNHKSCQSNPLIHEHIK